MPVSWSAVVEATCQLRPASRPSPTHAGVAASANMLLNGRITGISGIMSGVAFTNGLDTAWKTAFMGEP